MKKTANEGHSPKLADYTGEGRYDRRMGASVRVKKWRKVRVGEEGIGYSLGEERVAVGRQESGGRVRIEIPKERMWVLPPEDMPRGMIMEERWRQGTRKEWGMSVLFLGVMGGAIWWLGIEVVMPVMVAVLVGILLVAVGMMPRSMVAEISGDVMVVDVKQWIGRRVREVNRGETAKVMLEWKMRRAGHTLRIAMMYAVNERGKRTLLARSMDLRGMQLVVDEVTERWGLEKGERAMGEERVGEIARDPGECPAEFKLIVKRGEEEKWEVRLPAKRGNWVWIGAAVTPVVGVQGMMVWLTWVSGSRWRMYQFMGVMFIVMWGEWALFMRHHIVEGMGRRRIGFDGERVWGRNLNLLGIGDGAWNRWGIERVEIWEQKKRRGNVGTLVVQFRNGKKRVLVRKWEGKEVMYLGEMVAWSIGAEEMVEGDNSKFEVRNSK